MPPKRKETAAAPAKLLQSSYDSLARGAKKTLSEHVFRNPRPEDDATAAIVTMSAKKGSKRGVTITEEAFCLLILDHLEACLARLPGRKFSGEIDFCAVKEPHLSRLTLAAHAHAVVLSSCRTKVWYCW